MIDAFASLRGQLAKYEELREQLIAKSREVVRCSKLLIYAVHRGDKKEADMRRREIEGKVKELHTIAAGHGALDYSGSVKIAMQEYVEAVCVQQFSEKGEIPSAKELNADPEHYLLGICDLSGELVRMAVHAAIAGDLNKAKNIHTFLEELYGEMLKFDFRNGELRKKFDGMKYDLKKLEDLVLDLKLKG